MSYEPYAPRAESQTDGQRELISQLRGIRVTLIVGFVVLMLALAPWWLLGMGLLMDELLAGTSMGGD